MTKISFDVLLRAAGRDVPPSTATIDQLRPPPENIERCLRWLSDRGVTCHRTDFGQSAKM